MSEEESGLIVGRSFICDEDLRTVRHDGEQGFLVRVLLPSYRSLPLSCLEDIQLKVDGKPVGREDITLILNGYSHRIGETGELTGIYWFILDKADLFIRTDEPLGSAKHVVEGTMVMVEPYMTVGRFALNYTAQRVLSVVPGI